MRRAGIRRICPYVEEADDAPGMPKHSPGFPAGLALLTKIAL